MTDSPEPRPTAEDVRIAASLHSKLGHVGSPDKCCVPSAMAAVDEMRAAHERPPVDPVREAEIGWALGVLEADAVDPDRKADWRYGVQHSLSVIRAALSAAPAAPRPTHGRHCPCSACAREDWTNPDLAHCGMHGPSCPPVYAPSPAVPRPHDPYCRVPFPHSVCWGPVDPATPRPEGLDEDTLRIAVADAMTDIGVRLRNWNGVVHRDSEGVRTLAAAILSRLSNTGERPYIAPPMQDWPDHADMSCDEG